MELETFLTTMALIALVGILAWLTCLGINQQKKYNERQKINLEECLKITNEDYRWCYDKF